MFERAHWTRNSSALKGRQVNLFGGAEFRRVSFSNLSQRVPVKKKRRTNTLGFGRTVQMVPHSAQLFPAAIITKARVEWLAPRKAEAGPGEDSDASTVKKKRKEKGGTSNSAFVTFIEARLRQLEKPAGL